MRIKPRRKRAYKRTYGVNFLRDYQTELILVHVFNREEGDDSDPDYIWTDYYEIIFERGQRFCKWEDWDGNCFVPVFLAVKLSDQLQGIGVVV